jgi:hypothetical protein
MISYNFSTYIERQQCQVTGACLPHMPQPQNMSDNATLFADLLLQDRAYCDGCC